MRVDERFWSKVVRGWDEECWLWQASTTSQGYGQFRMEGRMVGAHRACWMITRGQHIPAGRHVLHSCDVPGCVNPRHLRLGTNADNVADKCARGRAKTWERSEDTNTAKLTPDDVRAIRAGRVGGASLHALAEMYGVHASTVSAIAARRTWRSV